MNIKWIIALTLAFLLTVIVNICCTFDYDNDYLNEPPDSIIGTPCYNLGDQVKYTYGQYYYCAECGYYINDLQWIEIDCDEIGE